MGTGLHAVSAAGGADEVVLNKRKTKPKLMKYEIYDQLQIADDFSIFDFVSEGRNGFWLIS
jgi:hypothetical protein